MRPHRNRVEAVRTFCGQKANGAWTLAAGSNGGCAPPWIFKHGTNIVDRG